MLFNVSAKRTEKLDKNIYKKKNKERERKGGGRKIVFNAEKKNDGDGNQL